GSIRVSSASVQARWSSRTPSSARSWTAQRNSISCAAQKPTSTAGERSTANSIGAIWSRRRIALREATHKPIKQSTLHARLTIRACREEDLPGLEWYGLFRHHRQ